MSRYLIKATHLGEVINGMMIPLGTIIMYHGIQPPYGWLECKGQECPEEYFDLAMLLDAHHPERLWPVLPDFQGRII